MAGELEMARVVAIGGGHGLSRALAACTSLGIAPTAVVTVADDGGSSGRLRRDLGIIALGDLRVALLTLARRTDWVEIFGHRFLRGHLQGHPLGNLLLVALTERADGDVLSALQRAADLLECEGAVIPSTTTPVTIHAQVSGRRIDGQVNVATAAGRLEAIWLEPTDPPACVEAVDAIQTADLVILGPGSLFTSVIVNLLVPDVTKAVRDTDAALVHVANLRTQPGETSGLSLEGHVAALHQYLDGRMLDAVVAHDGPRPEGAGAPLTATRGLPGVKEVLAFDLLSRDADGQPGAGHDATRLAEAFRRVLVDLGAGLRGDR